MNATNAEDSMIMFNGHKILISHKTSSPPIPERSS